MYGVLPESDSKRKDELIEIIRKSAERETQKPGVVNKEGLLAQIELLDLIGKFNNVLKSMNLSHGGLSLLTEKEQEMISQLNTFGRNQLVLSEEDRQELMEILQDTNNYSNIEEHRRNLLLSMLRNLPQMVSILKARQEIPNN